METLAYLHLAATYEASANQELGTAPDYVLRFPELDWTHGLSGGLRLWIFFAIALTSVIESSPALALERGNNSSEVTSLQKKLQAKGYFSGPITGYYGSLTEAGVIKFQKANGLNSDGVAGPQTLKVLESSSGTAANSQPDAPPAAIADDALGLTRPGLVLKRGNSSSEVTLLQQKLQAAGYYGGPIAGNYDSLTEAAVIKFQQANKLKTDGIAGPQTLKALASNSGTSAPSQGAPSPSVFNKTPFTEEKSRTPLVFQPAPSPAAVTDDPKKPENQGNQDNSQKTSERPQTEMKLKKTISGQISPKSVVHSGTGLFFAQNMMYSHTITVYDRKHNLVKTIPDVVKLSKYGYPKFTGNYKGAPVEVSFSHNGKYAWVSNYQMYGSGFNNPGSDRCAPSQKTDKSFLYRINTETLEIEKVIQVGSVPKFVATSPDNRLVLVSNWCSWDLSIVDTEQNQEIKRIKLGRYPRGIVVDAASEKAYVAVMGSEDIASVDLQDFSVGWLRNIGNAPRHLNIDPAGKYLYASLNGEGKIAKIDLATGKVLKKVVTGNAPRSMVLSDNGELIYVVNYGDNTVSKVRTSDMKVLQKVNVDANPIGITYDPQTREVWVACYSGKIMIFQD